MTTNCRARSIPHALYHAAAGTCCLAASGAAAVVIGIAADDYYHSVFPPDPLGLQIAIWTGIVVTAGMPILGTALGAREWYAAYRSIRPNKPRPSVEPR
jgi:hypothetical protein